MSTLLGVESRAGLVSETATLRFAALLGSSIAIFIALVLVVFFGFDSTPERLFALSIGHIFIAELALYASIRFGTALLLLVAISAIQVVLDGVQWVIRVVTFSLTVEQIVFLLFNTILLFFAFAYAGLAWRLWTITRKQPESVPTPERGDLIQQETNGIRVTALIGASGAIVVLLVAVALLSFETRPVMLLLFSAPHLILGPYAVWLGTNQRLIALPIALVLLALLQLGADLLQFVLRLADAGPLEISLNNIVELFLLLVNVFFIRIDLAYLIISIGYVYVLWQKSADESITTTTYEVQEENDDSQRQVSAEEPNTAITAMQVRRRRQKEKN